MQNQQIESIGKECSYDDGRSKRRLWRSGWADVTECTLGAEGTISKQGARANLERCHLCTRETRDGPNSSAAKVDGMSNQQGVVQKQVDVAEPNRVELHLIESKWVQPIRTYRDTSNPNNLETSLPNDSK